MQEAVDEEESHEQKEDFDRIESDEDVGVEAQTRQELADEEDDGGTTVARCYPR